MLFSARSRLSSHRLRTSVTSLVLAMPLPLVQFLRLSSPVSISGSKRDFLYFRFWGCVCLSRAPYLSSSVSSHLTVSTTFWKYFMVIFQPSVLSLNISYARRGNMPHNGWGSACLNHACGFFDGARVKHRKSIDR